MNEAELNTIIAKILGSMRTEWTVAAERSHVIHEGPGERPDLIITEPGATPIVVEVEWEPGRTVERDAQARLGKIITRHGDVAISVALTVPKKFKGLNSAQVHSALKTTHDLTYAVYFHMAPRFPDSGTLRGSLANLAMLIQTSFPPTLIKKCVAIMECGIEQNGTIMEQEDYETKGEVAQLLKQDPGLETYKMASLILQNAMLFYDQISGHHNIVHMNRLRVLGDLNYDLVIQGWSQALKIDYYPIFQIALDILKCFSCTTGNRILKNVDRAVQKIIQLGMSRSGDMHGILFQRLVESRKQLAAFYTLPESAALLAAVAVPTELDPVWCNKESIKKYVVADFACGTGMLLSATYRQIIHNCGVNHNNMRKMHSHMIANNLIGYDVLPIATHMTAAGLASLFPKTDFDTTRIKVLKLGKFTDDDYSDDENDLVSANVAYGLGSLGLMRISSVLRKSSKVVHSRESNMTRQIGISNTSCNLIIMNPPFTRNNRQSIKSDKGAIIPAFGAFGISDQDQKAMRKIRDIMYKDTCAAGHAGTASYFIALADKKLNYGGKLAVVALSSIMSGAAWRGVRELLASKYKNLILMSINSDKGEYNTAFSSDVKMSEVMIVAEKRCPSEVTKEIQTRMINVSLLQRPKSNMEAVAVANIITHYKKVPKLESGVYGAAELNVGNKKLGEMLDCPFSATGVNFGNIKDLTLLQFACRLSLGFVSSIDGFEVKIPMTQIGSLVKSLRLGGGGAKRGHLLDLTANY